MRPGAGAQVLLVLALAACSRGGQGDAPGESPRGQQGAGAAASTGLRCALAGAKSFARACTREIASGPDGEVWIVHHPDGGFRRFVLIDKGARIATADGAEEVHAERQGADLEVRVGTDRYLFPAAPAQPAGIPDARAS